MISVWKQFGKERLYTPILNVSKFVKSHEVSGLRPAIRRVLIRSLEIWLIPFPQYCIASQTCPNKNC